ncbi:MAG: hypothetical protein ABWX74_13495 [Aeromicrobium sp.]
MRIDRVDRPARESAYPGYLARMKLSRGIVAVGIAKKVYTEARKPENQARIKSAVDKVRSRGDKKS